MVKRELRTERGRLVLIGGDGADDTLLDAVEELARLRLNEPRPENGPLELAGRRVWCKAGHLRGRSRVRHAARRLLLSKQAPRLSELVNLTWLRERGFQAPEPLAAGVVQRTGLPGFQFLVTARLEHTRTLRRFLERGPEPEERAAILDELAEETARMHALRFVHRDLFPRNLLIGPQGSPGSTARRVAFLDAWAGGPQPRSRGPLDAARRGTAYDLACLMLYGCDLLTEQEQHRFFARYTEQRDQHGQPLRDGSFFERVRRERSALVRRMIRRPAQQRGHGAPREAWTPPAPKPTRTGALETR